MKTYFIAAAIVSCLLFNGCSTVVSTKEGHGHGGIPYYLPKPILHVKEPIEIKIIESLFAVVQIGGISQYLYPLGYTYESASKNLKELTMLSNHKLRCIPLPKQMTLLTEDTTTTKIENNDTNQTTTTTTTNKFEQISKATPDSAYSLKPSDISKSYEIVLIPDTDKAYELFIETSGLLNNDITLTLTNGWVLSSIGVKSNPDAIVNSLSSIVGSFIGAQKEIRVAELTKEQALELEKLKQQGVPSKEAEAQSQEANGQMVTDVSYTVLGFVKKVIITAIKPGFYDINDPNNISFKELNSVVWRPVSF